MRSSGQQAALNPCSLCFTSHTQQTAMTLSRCETLSENLSDVGVDVGVDSRIKDKLEVNPWNWFPQFHVVSRQRVLVLQ